MGRYTRLCNMCFILLVAACPVRAWAAAGECLPPPNEDCEGAIVLSTADLPYSVTAPLGCFNDIIDKPYFDILYRYDCTVSGEHIIDMCDSDGDTFVRVYTEGCGWADGIEFATGDDECPGSPPNADPRIAVSLDAGTTYWIELGTWRADPPWAPPPNAPYNFNISLAGAEQELTCDGSDVPTELVGDPANPSDTNGRGSVAQLYRIGTFEVTNAQYAQFLNAVAAADPNGLFDQSMTDSDRGGILRGGVSGSFVHWVKQSFGDKPVNFVTWPDAARYCNWLHNDKPTGPQGVSTTEAGAYDMSLPNDQITRTPAARWFLPTHDEWYKAAYYDPFDPGADAGGTPNYWNYPTRSDSLPAQGLADGDGNITNPGANVANYGGGADWNGENGNVTTAGGTTAIGPWGTFDMGGNVGEWTETPDTPIPGDPPLPTRTVRGGDFSNAGILMSTPEGFALAVNMVAGSANIAVRVATLVCSGDFNGDNFVDEVDFAEFEICFTGPDGGPLDPLCIAGDFDGDNDIDCDDWEQFLLAWTAESEAPNLPQCGDPADLDGDGAVNATDLALLLGEWGFCLACAADLDGNGVVNAADLALLLGSWGN